MTICKYVLDLIIDIGNFISIVEIKSGKTITKDFFKGINYFKCIVPDIIINKTALIYGGEDEYVHKGVHILPYSKVYINKV